MARRVLIVDDHPPTLALIRAVLEAAAEHDGKRVLSCARAFEIHRQHQIALRDIGKICNENGIKIRQCQLGCFA